MATWNPSDPTEPATLDKQRESPRANRALRDYVFLGHSRTLEKLAQTYASNPDAPTHSLDTLKKWSVAFSWTARVYCFDEIQRQNENNTYAERCRSILATGLALRVERVEKLKLAYAQIEPYLSRPEFIWQKLVKKLPTPDGGFEFVETFRFNGEIFSQARGILADIARETDNPGLAASLEPIKNNYDLSRLTSQELGLLEEITAKASTSPFDENDPAHPKSSSSRYYKKVSPDR